MFLKDNLSTGILFYTHCGYSWKFLQKGNFSHYNYFNSWKSIKFSILFTFFFVLIRFDKGENKKSCATCHIARCQGTVKHDMKCHTLKVTKLPYSNYSEMGMVKSNIANKKPPGVLHPSINKWIQLILLRTYGHFCDSDNGRQNCWDNVLK